MKIAGKRRTKYIPQIPAVYAFSMSLRTNLVQVIRYHHPYPEKVLADGFFIMASEPNELSFPYAMRILRRLRNDLIHRY